ncbi:MAG: FAD-binding protein, partial [Candidatus Limnocylindrales bacterium]
MSDGPEQRPHDVLVIGAGGAGLRAAIAAAAAGADVGLVCKSLLGKAHTVMAEGGVAAALGNVAANDAWQVHFRDTMVGGKLLNNPRMAQLHAQEAPDRVRELEAWGAVFDRTHDGRILQRPFGGHTYPRLAHVGDRTGLEMIRTLQDRAVAAGITVYMECTITHLLTWPDRVRGAFGCWRATGEPIVFPAKAVVLATGGVGRAFEITSNSWEYSGDGQALAYLAGAELIDMEFVQFHPTGMVWPPGVRGLLVTEAVRGEGGILRNGDGERFMWKYLPEDRRHEYAATDEEATRWVEALSAGRSTDALRPPELSTRDNVARAIYTEVKEGRGSPHGGVFLDISYLPPEHVRRKLPSMYEQFKELADVDITKGPMEVGPTTHYMMGGIRVDPDTGATTRAGLYAAGEVAAGLHGANRLGGNSLSDLLVFGQRTGAAAAADAATMDEVPRVDPVQIRAAAEELAAPFGPGPGEDPYRLHEELQATMQSLVGIFR